KFSKDADYLTDSVRHYLQIPPELRTHFTDIFIGVELVSAGLARLDEKKLATPDTIAAFQSGMGAVKNFFEDAVMDLTQLFLGHRSLPSTMIEGVMNRIFNDEKEIQFFRVHVNMTTINEMDHTGELGTTYLQVVLEWLQSKGFRVVQNPENTTFLFLATDAQVRPAMNSFTQEIKSIMRDRPNVPSNLFDNVEPEAHISRRSFRADEIAQYAIQNWEDFEAFWPVLGFGYSHWINLEQRYKEEGMSALKGYINQKIPVLEIKASQDVLSIKKLEALVIKGVLQFLKELAAQTTYFEKVTDAAQKQTLYGEELLPKPDTEERFNKWQDYLQRGAGFVGPAIFDPIRYFPELADFASDAELDLRLFGLKPEHELPEWVEKLVTLVPRRSRFVGYLNHQRVGSPGGALQQMETALNELGFTLVSDAENKIKAVTEKAKSFAAIFEAMYKMAIQDERNPFLPRRMRTFDLARGMHRYAVEANFFMEKVVLDANELMAVMEIDSFKAYNETHPAQGYDDADFNCVLSQIFLVAKEMNMKMPHVRRAAGDQITLSFNGTTTNGIPVDPVAFCRQIQAKVKKYFEEKQFQEQQKVTMAYIPLQVDLPAEVTLNSNWFLKKICEEHGLKALPYVDSMSRVGGRQILILAYPITGDSIAQDEVQKILALFQAMAHRESGLKLGLQVVDKPRIEKKRLKIWQQADSKELKLVYAKEAPTGYIPFNRKLTVSLALGNHQKITGMTEAKAFIKKEDDLGHKLGAIKEAALPYKEAFGDFRETASHPTDPNSGPKGAGDNLSVTSSVLSTDGDALLPGNDNDITSAAEDIFQADDGLAANNDSEFPLALGAQVLAFPGATTGPLTLLKAVGFK
ncbi:MAG: hypothetical protein ACD_73C00744G0002, partial [uncultured bacterium]